MRYFIVGMGRVGSSLFSSLKGTKYTFMGYFSSKKVNGIPDRLHYRQLGEIPDVDIIFITLPDDKIEEISKKINRKACFCHTSGFRNFSVLPDYGLGRVSMHPIHSIPEMFSDLSNLFWGVNGDKIGKEKASKLISAMGGKIVYISDEAKPLYHAINVISSNILVSIYYLLSNPIDKLNLPLEPFLQLSVTSLKNIEQFGVLNALTGPVERGDLNTFRKDIEALRNGYPDIFSSLKELFMTNIEIARRKGLNEEILKHMSDIINT